MDLKELDNFLSNNADASKDARSLVEHLVSIDPSLVSQNLGAATNASLAPQSLDSIVSALLGKPGFVLSAALKLIMRSTPEKVLEVSPIVPDLSGGDWENPLGIYSSYGSARSRNALLHLLRGDPNDQGDCFDLKGIREYADRTINPHKQKYPEKEVKHLESIEKEVKDFFLKREGSFFLASDGNGGFIVDLTLYRKYGVRRGFRPYGSVMKLAGGSMTIDDVSEVQDGFKEKLHVFLSTLAVEIILRVHAIFCHLVVAQKLFVDATRYYNKRLTKEERELIALLTHRTNDINSNIPVLVGSKGSLFHRAFAFELSELQILMKEIYEDYLRMDDEAVAQYIIGLKGTPWYQKAFPYYTLCKDHISKLLSAAQGGKSCFSPTRYANCLFVSTMLHEAFGDMQLSSILYWTLPSRIRKDGALGATEESMACVVAATVAVGTRIPKMIHHHSEGSEQWKKFLETAKAIFDGEKWIEFSNFEISVGY